MEREREQVRATRARLERDEQEFGLRRRPKEHVEACEILGLNPMEEFSEEDLKQAYRRCAKQSHPDLGGSQEQFLSVQKAYSILTA
jgi:DnaJ-class molecular chaperone